MAVDITGEVVSDEHAPSSSIIDGCLCYCLGLPNSDGVCISGSPDFLVHGVVETPDEVTVIGIVTRTAWSVFEVPTTGDFNLYKIIAGETDSNITKVDVPFVVVTVCDEGPTTTRTDLSPSWV